ncbi:MAG: BtrH N-terminal domain-containing protein [Flavobacteriales bacterium]|nr:BtrH N-terminal domain-containing protein [Flavobacteriales bacterium]
MSEFSPPPTSTSRNASFRHVTAAHCENGATAALLLNKGWDISEPLIFGIGSGLFFSHMPFIRLHGMPVTSFRPLPGAIFRRATHRLGIPVHTRSFRHVHKAMEALDRNLEQGIPTGCLVGVFHLPYFPPHYRFHFNAHNLVVFKKEGPVYHVSDPVMQQVTQLTEEELARVRFAKGTAAPKGKMYWIDEAPATLPIKTAILKGLRSNMYDMLRIPLPYFGVKGIRFLASRLRRWPMRMTPKQAALNLGQIVRMQEEIGTGGAGFRYLYAAFLSEAATHLDTHFFQDMALRMNTIGDLWRDFAVEAARICKNRGQDHGPAAYHALSQRLLDIAGEEEKTYKTIASFVRKLPLKP